MEAARCVASFVVVITRQILYTPLASVSWRFFMLTARATDVCSLSPTSAQDDAQDSAQDASA